MSYIWSVGEAEVSKQHIYNQTGSYVQLIISIIPSVLSPIRTMGLVYVSILLNHNCCLSVCSLLRYVVLEC